MPTVRYALSAVLLAFACATGCAGNGEGLDQNGQPIGAGGASAPDGTVTADFQSIQENIFTPICSKCHIGGSAPEGLQLDAAHSYNLLVGVPSTEQPALQRIKAGDPDDSYLIRKIEGAAGIVGGQMPLGETPLPASTITAIRQWVSDGASNSPPSATAAFAVRSTFPAHQAQLQFSPTVLIAFTRPVDVTLVNDTSVVLARIIDPQHSTPVAAALTVAQGNGSVLLIKPTHPLMPGHYRLMLRGTGGAALADMNAATLGADVEVDFVVEAGI